MKIGKDGRFHLTYCTKIHPANGWQELSETLDRHIPVLKSRLSPDRPFGIGLRLSATESVQLLEPARLEAFQDFLARHDCYVFTINGFPFGAFSGQPVKSRVFAPDWQDEERVQYTLRLIEILRRLLPAGTEGSISTLPLSYKSWVLPHNTEKAMARIVQNLMRIVESLIPVQREHGFDIHLDIEPEPDGLVEDVREFIRFYRKWLLPFGAPLLAGRLRINQDEARRHIQKHIQLCLDTCHLAVMYEEPAEVLPLLAREGIGVGKVQIASGLKVLLPAPGESRTGLAQCLDRFSRSFYLHQVIGRGNRGISSRFPDLCQALPHLETCRDREWRIHYHMPLFVERYRLLESTQAETRQVLQLLQETGFTRHLEIETYTWNQLPDDLKIDLIASLLKEYGWVLEAWEKNGS